MNDYDFTFIPDEDLVESVRQAHEAQERIAAGVGTEDDYEFVDFLSDEVWLDILGLPTLGAAEREAELRGLSVR
jgi:hypothetical protein